MSDDWGQDLGFKGAAPSIEKLQAQIINLNACVDAFTQTLAIANKIIADTTPKAAAFDKIVEHELNIGPAVTGKPPKDVWIVSDYTGNNEIENADLLTAITGVCKKIEGRPEIPPSPIS